MRTRHVFHAVDSHTEGMPTRVITAGVATLPGDTMADRREYFLAHRDHVRTLLMTEPRGHAAMSGAILQPATRPDADYGVLYIEVSGCLPMCGHGTIGVATVLVETGMVDVTEPTTTIRLDTPAGLVAATVKVGDGAAESVTLHNVASYCDVHDADVQVPGYGTVRYDLAYGGNFYAITDLAALGIPFDRAAKDDILAAGLAIMAAVNAAEPPVHPEQPHIAGLHHVQFLAPGADNTLSRHAMVIHPGWFDRSPCGTGTSARIAQLHSRGMLAAHTDMVSESFIGSRFTGRIIGHTTVAGIPAVLPTITGRAWITGTAQYFLDPSDPFPAGFQL
jgi:proline racemase